MTRDLRRFAHLPHPRPGSWTLPVGLMTAGALALVAVVAVGQLSRTNSGPGQSTSPLPSSSPSVLSSELPSPSVLSSEAPPTTRISSERASAQVLAEFPACFGLPNWAGAELGDQVFSACWEDSAHPDFWLSIIQVDAKTNKIVQKIDNKNMYGLSSMAVAGDAIWFSPYYGSCTADMECPNETLYRFDLKTKKRTVMQNTTLVDEGLGYVWVSQKEGELAKVDPKTGIVVGRIPLSLAEWVDVACGSLWASSADSSDQTTVRRVDPETGQTLGSFTWPGGLSPFHAVEGECWASAYENASVGETGNSYNIFVRIGSSGVDLKSPVLVSGGPGDVVIVGSSFWIQAVGVDSPLLLQRIDPATWLPVGPAWESPGWPIGFTAGGTMWVGVSSLQRLDIPVTP